MIARRFAPASLHRGHSIPAESPAMNVHRRNLVGPEIRKLRRQLGWTQDKLAKGLRREGLNVSRSAVAKIECQLIWVGDFELLYFVRVLGVRLEHLFPPINGHIPLAEVLPESHSPKPHPQSSLSAQVATTVTAA